MCSGRAAAAAMASKKGTREECHINFSVLLVTHTHTWRIQLTMWKKGLVVEKAKAEAVVVETGKNLK